MTMPSSPPERRVRGAGLRTIVIAALATAAVFGGLYLWRSARMDDQGTMQMPPVSVAAMQVTPSRVPAHLRAVGSLRAVQEVVLAPEVAGRISALMFEPGGRVAAGTVLAHLDHAPELADRDAALALVRFARSQASRSRELSATGSGSRERTEQRAAELEEAEATVRQLDARIAQKQIRAPFSGVLGVRRVNLGQYVNPGDAITTLVALDSLYVDFTVPQQSLAQLKVGGTVSISSDAWPDRMFTGEVNVVEPRVDEATRSVLVQAIVANPDGALRPGMYVAANLELAPDENALVLPATSIQTSAAGDAVTKIGGANPMEGGPSQIVPVTVGRRLGDRVVVASGLAPGDVVVTEGQDRIPPGGEVKVARRVALEQ